ncbi:MAG: lipopolysaccharide biosynthesis protein [Clostridia bacterium]|nr:lipopolysaccharide biosynthesis protein [Clostridia bacterium]
MINILFCGNVKVFDGILTSMLSITKRTKEPITIHIFTMDVSRIKDIYTPITKKQVSFLNEIIKKQNENSEVKLYDVTDIYEKEFSYCPNEMAYCSPYTLLRLLADKVEGMPDKLLYLDIDLMVNSDIKELYDIDITNYEYAASKDQYAKYLLFWRVKYLNAGVMLLNMKKIKETNMLEKARQLIKTKKMTFADQDAVYYSTTKMLRLPQRFNDQRRVRKNTVIRHFAKRHLWLPHFRIVNIKQWDISNIHKEYKCYNFDEELYEYVYLKKYFENNYKEN